MPARSRVEITPSAENDVEDIWTFISRDSPARAESLVAELERQVRSLERFPLRCPLIPENELLGARYRHLIHGECRTIFKVDGRSVFILRIVHGAKLLDDSLFD